MSPDEMPPTATAAKIQKGEAVSTSQKNGNAQTVFGADPAGHVPGDFVVHRFGQRRGLGLHEVLLHQRQAPTRAVGQLEGDPAHRRTVVVLGDHTVEKPEPQALLGRQPVAQEHQLSSRGHPAQPIEQPRDAEVAGERDPGEAVAMTAPGAADPQVRGQREAQSGPGRRAGQRGDDRQASTEPSLVVDTSSSLPVSSNITARSLRKNRATSTS